MLGFLTVDAAAGGGGAGRESASRAGLAALPSREYIDEEPYRGIVEAPSPAGPCRPDLGNLYLTLS